MTKRIFLLFAAMFISLSLTSGCLTYTIETKLDPDGSGQRSIDIEVDQSFALILEENAKGDEALSLEKELKEGLPEGATFRRFSRGEKIHYETRFSFDSAEELNKINQSLSKKEKGQTPRSDLITLDRKDLFFVVNFQFHEKFAPSQKSADIQKNKLIPPFTAVYKLTMPGELVKTNAEKVKSNQATWYINPLKGGEIKATSYYVRWWAVILAAVVLLTVVIAIAATLWLRLKKKTPQPEAVSPRAG